MTPFPLHRVLNALVTLPHNDTLFYNFFGQTMRICAMFSKYLLIWSALELVYLLFLVRSEELPVFLDDLLEAC
jgi:hypothetical protein